MDNPPFLLRLSIKMPLFMDDPAYFLSTIGRHSVDNPPQIICRLSAEGSSDSCALLFCQTASTQGRRNP